MGRRAKTWLLVTIVVLGAAMPAAGWAAAANSVRPIEWSGSRFICFDVVPPRQGAASCDTLCGAKGAACVGLNTKGAANTDLGCSDFVEGRILADLAGSCRCCGLDDSVRPGQ
jgi:hypothetical protein